MRVHIYRHAIYLHNERSCKLAPQKWESYVYICVHINWEANILSKVSPPLPGFKSPLPLNFRGPSFSNVRQVLPYGILQYTAIILSVSSTFALIAPRQCLCGKLHLDIRNVGTYEYNT